MHAAHRSQAPRGAKASPRYTNLPPPHTADTVSICRISCYDHIWTERCSAIQLFNQKKKSNQNLTSSGTSLNHLCPSVSVTLTLVSLPAFPEWRFINYENTDQKALQPIFQRLQLSGKALVPALSTLRARQPLLWELLSPTNRNTAARPMKKSDAMPRKVLNPTWHQVWKAAEEPQFPGTTRSKDAIGT